MQSKVHVSTSLQRIVLVRAEKPTDTVQKIKQRTAFPPNYIHSIDSSHMMLTAIACQEEGALKGRGKGGRQRAAPQAVREQGPV